MLWVDGHLMKTPLFGSENGGVAWERIGYKDDAVVGFQVVTAQQGASSAIRWLEPIFARQQVAMGNTYLAENGYAVGGVLVDGDQQINAIRIVFMRVRGTGLDTRDSYQSAWIGQPTRSTLYLLGGTGHRVIGIYGRHDTFWTSLGLDLLQSAAPPQR